jgi:hypothetical protein
METKTVEPAASNGHPRVVTALLVVGTLVAFLAIFSIWVNRQALNTENWVDTSGRVLQNEEVQAQLSDYVAAQLFANVDVAQELEGVLPPKLAPLAGVAAGGLQQLVPQVAQRAFATTQVQQLWEEANGAAHRTLLEVLDGGNSTVSTGGGEVSLDLGALIERIGQQVGIGSTIAAKIPANAGKLTILKSDQISTAQSVVKLVRRLPVVLTLLALLLYGLAIGLAGPRRRRALRSVGLGFVVAGVLALLVRSIGGHAVIGSLVSNQAAKPAAEAVWSIGTSLLVTVASSAIVFGLLVVIGAWLAGPTRIALRLRREAAPYVREQQAAAYGVAAIVYVALIAWAPIAAFRKPLGVLLFALLLAAGTEILRRQILREFPAGRSAPPA